MPRRNYASDSSCSSSDEGSIDESFSPPPSRTKKRDKLLTKQRKQLKLAAQELEKQKQALLLMQQQQLVRQPQQQQQQVGRQQHVIQPVFMGGSMCATNISQSAPPLQLGHPSANALNHMTLRPPTGPSLVPVTSRIAEPMRMDPVPFDGGAPTFGELTSDYPITNERPRPMANIPTWQTPILPFSKSSDTGAYDLNRSPMQLFQAQGMDQDSWRPKREQAPMFTPQQQNIFGMPAQAQVQRNRYEPSLELKHQKPFEAEWSLRSGGFHPTTRILPTNVPVLRQQLCSNRAAAPTVATSHPSGLFGENRGELGLVERRGTDNSTYYHVPFPTSNPVQAAPQYAPREAKPTSRQATSVPYGGQANATGNGAGSSYVKGQYLLANQKLVSQIHERMQQAGGPSLVQGGATTAHYMDEARPTLLEATEMNTSAGVSGVRAPISSGTAHFMDAAKPTLLEGTEMQVRASALNGQGQAPTNHFMDIAKPTLLEGTEMQVRASALNGQGQAPTNHFMDSAKPTLLEGTEMQVRASALNGANQAPMLPFSDEAKPTRLEGTEMATEASISGPMSSSVAPMTYLQDEARPTLKQGTSNHSYEGGANSIHSAPMQTDSYLDARLNEKLEVAMTVDRAPAMGSIGTTTSNADRLGFGDASTVRMRDDNLVQQYDGIVDRSGQNNTRWIPQVTVRDQKANVESLLNQRNDCYVLTGLAENPFALPKWSIQ